MIGLELNSMELSEDHVNVIGLEWNVGSMGMAYAKG